MEIRTFQQLLQRQIEDATLFLTNSSLHATPDWVQGCVEFFCEERENRRIPNLPNDLRSFVLDQWNLADLREMGRGCLPPDLKNVTKTILTGKYAVQVEWIKDVGKPAYSQLQDIWKQTNENTEVGTTKPQSWEPSPTRMLQLSICDGKQCIKGMEYKPINTLKDTFLPGFKALIIGPVECRRGVLLLEEKNIKILGGEIDSLLIQNSRENILARTLNVPENPDPYRIQSARPNTSTEIQVAERNTEDDFLQEGDLMLGAEMDEHLLMLEQQFQEEMENASRNTDIVALDAIEQKSLRELQSLSCENSEFNNFNHIPNSSKPTTSNVQEVSNFGHKPNSSKPTSSNVQDVSAEENDTSHLLDEDDDFFCEMPFETIEKSSTRESTVSSKLSSKLNLNKTKPSSNEHSNRLSVPQSKSIVTQSKIKEPQIKSVSTVKPNIPSLHQTKSIKSKAQNSNVQSKITSFLNKSTEASDSGICSAVSNRSEYNNSVPTNNSTVQRSFKKETFVCQELEAEPVMLSDMDFEEFTCEGRLTDCSDEKLRNTVYNHREHDRSDLTNNSAVQKNYQKEKLPQEFKAEPIVISDDEFEEIMCNQRTVGSGDKKLGDKIMTPIMTDPEPFVYLNEIKTPVDSCKVCTVKAFVITLLSQLTCGMEGWHLNVKLCDGVSNLDVKLSPNVLEKLIGYSVAEMRIMKQNVPKNPLLKDKMKNILENAQQRLINLNCLLTIKFLPGSEYPLVIDIQELTVDHLKSLQARVNSAYTILNG